MPLAEWGTKRVCPTTGKRFYDLNRSPIVSPYTGEVVDIESARRKMAAAVIARVQPEKDDDAVLVEVDVESDSHATNARLAAVLDSIAIGVEPDAIADRALPGIAKVDIIADLTRCERGVGRRGGSDSVEVVRLGQPRDPERSGIDRNAVIPSWASVFIT